MKTNSLILALTAAMAFTPLAIIPAQAAPAHEDAPNACALLSRLEVGEAAGTTVGEGELRLRTETVTRCLFPAPNGGNIALLVRRMPAGDWESEQRERFHRGVQLGAYREMAGIGDRAFSSKIGQGSILCVFVGEYYLQVSLYRMGEASGESAHLEKLARRALTRLGSDAYGGMSAASNVTAARLPAQR